ncbi:beta-ketoacyl synthase chain length factor [bacterium]|nr:beta-ketoacyl synthase chain length factor [bacterium]
MVKRRSSNLTKIAVSVALECDMNNNANYSIFCSRHGELHHTEHLLKNLALKEDLSPTEFSQSVHNTAAGLYSIITNNQSPSTAIAAGTDTFIYGLLEASTFLQCNPGQKVLVLSFDEPVPRIFGSVRDDYDSAYGAAFMFSDNASMPGIQVNIDVQGGTDVDHTPVALQLIKFWQSSEVDITVYTQNMSARLRRYD